MGDMKTQRFKPYTPKQAMLMPANLEEMIPEKHLVRIIDEMIERLDITPLKRQYKGGGTSAYHPRMLLKVLVYAYSQQTFSSRKIAKALRENIHYMWLSGMSRPDHRTINRFRGVVMKEVVEEVFYGVVEQLFEMGYIELEKYFVDGTKIEANANRYSFVWRKSTKRYKANLQEKVRKLLDEIEEIEEAEEALYGDQDYPEVGERITINKKGLQEAADRISQKLRKDPQNKKLKKAKRDLEQDFIPREEKYEKYEEILGDRNSFSKTDEDATFMRMKEDHMRNGQLKPGYNIQTGTENQFVTGYSIHQKPGDTSCLKDHLEQRKRWLGKYPQVLVADAGYGSEENYAYLKDRNITAYVKYNIFHYEQKKRIKKKKPYRQESFQYNPEKDEYRCPQNKVLSYKYTKDVVSANRYHSTRRIYECSDCQDCPVKTDCTKSKYNRRLYIGVELLQMRKTARDLLLSPEGVKMRSQRPVEVEAVYGRLKHNWGFRRFLLRGIDKVKVEWGLLTMAHNIAKVAAH
jgi:transposase